jgi:voltage-gated potassium channel Kch
MAYYDPSIANGNWLIVDGWYFLFATMTTVGLGDYAPETQLSRGFAIVMIPSGMVVLSMVLAGISMYNKSLTPTLKADPGFNRSAEAHKLFEAIDVNNDGVLSRDEVMGKSFECLGISPEEACDLFDSLDLDKSGTLELNKIEENGLSFEWNSVPMRFLFLFLKLYCTIALGAVFFKLHGQFGAADNLSWVDCFYWATVVSTSVGYGDITPSTYEGKLFLTFYMVFSTVITAQVLGSMISLYVNDVVAERIVAKLIDSTIWVHKVDISDPSDKKNYGQITESDFGEKSILLSCFHAK